MKANQNNCKVFCKLITTALVAIGVVVISTLPISTTAIAGESNKNIIKSSTVRQSATGRAHASANSVVGLLAIYRQKFNGNNEVDKNRAELLDNRIAAMEMDLSNPHLLDEKRILIQKNLSMAEAELAEILRQQENSAPPMRQNGQYLTANRLKTNILRFVGIEPNEEIDMAVASGKTD